MIRVLTFVMAAALLLACSCADDDDTVLAPSPEIPDRLSLRGPIGRSVDRLRAVAADPSAGNATLYLLDAGNARVLVCARRGYDEWLIVREWGGPGAADGEFREPSGIAAHSGRIYVVDSGNDRIQVFAPDGEFLASWPGGGDSPGLFTVPTGIACGPDGTIHVADTGNSRIRVFDGDGNWQRDLTADGDGVPLDRPHDVAVDQVGSVHVCDTHNHRIVSYTASGESYAVTGGLGDADSSFFFPRSLGASDAIVVADTGNRRICQYDLDLTLVGIEDAFDGIVATDQPFPLGQAFAVDNHGGWIVDGERDLLVAIDAYGRPRAERIHGQVPGMFSRPQAICVAGSGCVYVMDVGAEEYYDPRYRIQLFDQHGNFVRIMLESEGIRGIATSGSDDLLVLIPTNYPNRGWVRVHDVSGRLVRDFHTSGGGQPVAIATDELDQVYVVTRDEHGDDQGAYVFVYTAAGELLATWRLDSRWRSDTVVGVAGDGAGGLFIASHDRIERLDEYGERVLVIDPDAAIRSISRTGDKLYATGVSVLIAYDLDLEQQNQWSYVDGATGLDYAHRFAAVASDSLIYIATEEISYVGAYRP